MKVLSSTTQEEKQVNCHIRRCRCVAGKVVDPNKAGLGNTELN